MFFCGERETEEDVVMRTWKMKVIGHRKITRTKLMWTYITQKDMKETRVQREGAQDRKTWRMKI